MKNSELLSAIRSYCKDQNFQNTLQATEITNKKEKAEDKSVVEMFEKYFKKRNKREELSFTFKLPNQRSQLRKRLLDTVSDHRQGGIKKRKVIKSRKISPTSCLMNTFLFQFH